MKIPFIKLFWVYFSSMISFKENFKKTILTKRKKDARNKNLVN